MWKDFPATGMVGIENRTDPFQKTLNDSAKFRKYDFKWVMMSEGVSVIQLDTSLQSSVVFA